MNWPAHIVCHHHVVCRHQVEIEVSPAQVELYFSDERYVDPINTQLRFTATVFNAPNNAVNWQVANLMGGPGAGTIDSFGLYRAPAKGSLPSGHTDLVIASAKADPKRRAVAKITLIGEGPEVQPVPVLEVYPRVTHLYYQAGSGLQNGYIDVSNKEQRFRALVRNASNTAVTWSIASGTGSINSDGLYIAPYQGSSLVTARIEARLNEDPSVTARARVILLNYSWPNMISD